MTFYIVDFLDDNDEKILEQINIERFQRVFNFVHDHNIHVGLASKGASSAQVVL